MLTVTGTLEHHRSVRGGWAVVDFLVAEGTGDLRQGEEITATGGLLGHAAVGERLRLHGKVEEHPRFGPQFKVERYESLGITDRLNAHRWLTRLDGVGPVRAAAIMEHTLREGLDVVELLNTDPTGDDPLAEVEGIGPGTAATIRRSWAKVGLTVDPETLAYLGKLGLSAYETDNVIEHAHTRGRKPRELLELEPYSLTARKGFGFIRVDRIALKAGVHPQAPARLQAAAKHVLADHIAKTGDTYAAASVVVSGDRKRSVVGVVDLTGSAPLPVLDALRELAHAEEVVLTEQGKRVHPAKLLQAERTVHRLIRGGGCLNSNPSEPTRAEGGSGEGAGVNVVPAPPTQTGHHVGGTGGTGSVDGATGSDNVRAAHLSAGSPGALRSQAGVRTGATTGLAYARGHTCGNASKRQESERAGGEVRGSSPPAYGLPNLDTRVAEALLLLSGTDPSGAGWEGW